MKILQIFADCAAGTPAAPEGKVRPCDIGVSDPITNANTLVPNVLNTVYVWAGIIAVLIIVIAGFLYVTADGDSSQIKRAKDAILGAAVGLIVIIMAFVITQFVVGRF